MEYLSAAALQAGAVVLLVQEIMKLEIIPGSWANKYPVPVNLLLSVVATLGLVRPTLSWENVPELLVQVGTVAVVAAIAYNQLVKKWLKPVEGPSA